MKYFNELDGYTEIAETATQRQFRLVSVLDSCCPVVYYSGILSGPAADVQGAPFLSLALSFYASLVVRSSQHLVQRRPTFALRLFKLFASVLNKLTLLFKRFKDETACNQIALTTGNDEVVGIVVSLPSVREDMVYAITFPTAVLTNASVSPPCIGKASFGTSRTLLRHDGSVAHPHPSESNAGAGRVAGGFSGVSDKSQVMMAYV